MSERATGHRGTPLTPSQQGMLVNSLRAGGKGVEIEQVLVRLREPIDVPRLRAAWSWASQRHAALRTAFHWQDGAPRQHAADRAPMPFERCDQRRLGEAERERALERHLERDRERGFDLAVPPLARLALFTRGPADHVLVWTFHHAVLDGRSAKRVLREVFARHDAALHGRAHEPPAPPPFREHCEHLARRDTTAERAFWSEQLRGFGAPTPLPAARPRLGGGPRRRHEAEIRIGGGTVKALAALGHERGFTLANTVQGAWAVLLSRHAGAEDVCFGSTRAARRSSVPRALDMVGCLVNTVPLRVRVRPDDTVAGLLSGLRRLNLALRPHEQAPLAGMRAFAGPPHTAPLFESLVAFEHLPLEAEMAALGGRWASREVSVREQTDIPLVVTASQHAGDLILGIAHDPRRFDDGDAASLLDQLATLLAGMATGPDARLSDLPLVSPAERARILASAGGDGPLLAVGAASWPEAFTARVAASPRAVALVHKGRAITYSGLERLAAAAAARLTEAGIGRGEVVAVCLRRSPRLAAALLAVLRTGAVYLPLDPAWPAERLALVLRDSGARVVLTEEAALGTLEEARTRTDLGSLRAIALDAALPRSGGRRGGVAARLRSRPAPPPLPPLDPEDPAYLIYTSGSTGRPKGVLVPHRALLAHARAIVPAFGLGPQDRVLQFTAPSFDVSLEELLPTWLAGGCVVLPDKAAAGSIEGFLRMVGEHRVSVLNLPSAYFGELALQGPQRLPSSVRLLVVGGERPSAAAYARWRAAHPHVRFLNAYGPTEVTITSSFCDPVDSGVPPDGFTELPIGRPLGTCRAYVLDERGEPTPPGMTGELCLAGPQVALGYLGREELTARRFVPDPFMQERSVVPSRDAHGAAPAAAGGARMYRTGDRVRRGAGGELHFLGRADDQVKVRGYRIEPAEIEAVLLEDPRVREAAVAARPGAGGALRLMAWAAAEAGPEGAREALARELRERCALRLPEHMLPAAVVVLERLPRTPGGKLDRSLLPEPEPPRAHDRFVEPEGDVELWLASLYAELLGHDRVAATDGFFELGGDSLLALRLLSRINTQVSAPLGLGTIFVDPTVRGVARALASGATATRPMLVPLNRAGPGRPPLFCICGVQLYRRLGRALEAERGVFGAFLPAEADALLAGGRVPIDVPAMARAYLELVRGHRPHGPYVLGGVSFGGILAWEMAQQLRERGEEVALVVLLDTILPRALIKPGLRERCKLLVRGVDEQRRLLVARLRERLRAALRRSPRRALRPPSGAVGPGLLEASSERDVRFLRGDLYWRAAKAYDRRIRPYDGRVLLVRAREGLAPGEADSARDLGWDGLLPPHARVHVVPGEHLTILDEPGVHEIAREIGAALEPLDAQAAPAPLAPPARHAPERDVAVAGSAR